MAESSKRVIVDGVEFGRVWQFPRMLGAITSAMQPGRLILALFMVILLIAVGRLWDRVTEPSVPPSGLTTGRYESWFNDGAHQQTLRESLRDFAPDRIVSRDDVSEIDPNIPTYDTGDVRDWIDDGYHDLRAEGQTDADRMIIDARYAATLDQIEMTRPRGDFEATVQHLATSFRSIIDGAFNLSPTRILGGLHMTLIDTPRALWRHQTWFALIFGLFTIIVLSIGGGAIARMTASQQATRERLSLGEATDFALSRWGALIWAMLLPLVLLMILGVIILVIGAIMRVPVLDVIMALFYGFVLLIGFLMAFVFVCYVVGWPLLTAAVACENSDGMDAMQRTYAYVVTRPLHALWYWAVGLFGLAIGFAIVTIFAAITLNITGSIITWLAPSPIDAAVGGYDAATLERLPESAMSITARSDANAPIGNWHQRWAANILLAWQSLVVALAAAYVISYVFTAGTIAYLLLRKASDGQETDEIWRSGGATGANAPVAVAAPASAADGRAAFAREGDSGDTARM